MENIKKFIGSGCLNESKYEFSKKFRDMPQKNVPVPVQQDRGYVLYNLEIRPT